MTTEGHNSDMIAQLDKQMLALSKDHASCKEAREKEASQNASDIKTLSGEMKIEFKELRKLLTGNGKIGILANIKLSQGLAIIALFVALTAFTHNGGEIDPETLKPLVKAALTAMGAP
jgi:hypothetical protein